MKTRLMAVFIALIAGVIICSFASATSPIGEEQLLNIWDEEVYNITGQLIKNIVNGNQSAGTHAVTWNGKDEAGRDVSGGIYFYRLKTGELEATKKLILLK